MKLHGLRVLVLGMARSGCAAARLLLHRGALVTAADANMAILRNSPEVSQLCSEGLRAVTEQAVDAIATFDLVVCSPGIPSSHYLLLQAQEQGVNCLGEIELALRCLPKTKRFLGITGTNGKTTVTLMVAHVLKACGIPAKAVGNVGVALCGEVDHGAEDEVLVMELSSYQLERLREPVIDAAVLLNITPDHLDRHGTMEAYARAKIGIAGCLKPQGILFVHADTATEFGYLLQDVPARVYGGVGTHDEENREAARCLCASMGVTPALFDVAVATFRKPPHRIEFVCRYSGVDYYNDSKGTNLDAVEKAVAVVPGPILLIAGGVDKGASYVPWIKTFADKVRAIYAIGQAAPKIQRELSHALTVEIAPSLEVAVWRAAAAARSGESVLLSPGCSSFDMFRDYAHRGDEFKRIVRELPDNGSR